jgi:hypothetical protein
MSEGKGIGQFPKGIDPALIHLTGTIVTWWGRIEGILVHDLITLRQHPMNAAFVAKELFPVQTGRVIQQWAKLQRRYYATNQVRIEKLEKLIEELSDGADERNILVHYFWPYGAVEGDETITLQSIKPKKGQNDMLEIKQAVISVEKLDELNERLVRLYHHVMADQFNLLMKTNRERNWPAKGDIGEE